MADNYLEKKFEEFEQNKASGKIKKCSSNVLSLNSLLLKNRSYRGYDSSYIVTPEQLESIIEVNTKIPSARNGQVLRFLPVVGQNAKIVLENTKLGGALPQLGLPFKGTEPNAYIIICSTVAENKWVDIDLGISCQSMLLKAVELGLNGVCIGAFNKEKIVEAFNLEYTPVLILAIGKGAENIQLIPIGEGDSHNYYRKDGVHFVPKLQLKDLLIK